MAAKQFYKEQDDRHKIMYVRKVDYRVRILAGIYLSYIRKYVSLLLSSDVYDGLRPSKTELLTVLHGFKTYVKPFLKIKCGLSFKNR